MFAGLGDVVGGRARGECFGDPGLGGFEGLGEGDAPLVALFGMMLAHDLPAWFRGQTWEEPPLIIRTQSGTIHPEYSALKLAIGFPP